MGILKVNHFSDIFWHAYMLDLFFVTAVSFGVYYAYRQFDEGQRVYAIIMATAFFYGLMIEVSGMYWHSSYTQGDFLLMWTFTNIDAFSHSTDMPFYAPLFYPVMLLMIYKVVEPFGIRKPLTLAACCGFAAVILDAPYVIQGGQPHVVWWTWHEWILFQHWLTWPVLDAWWHLTWHAFLLWLVVKNMRRVDAWFQDEGGFIPYLRAFLVLPLTLAVVVNLVGPILHLPLSIPTYTVDGFQQYPWVAFGFGFAGLVFLFSEKNIDGRFQSMADAFVPVLYLLVMSVLVLDNLRIEGGFRDYILVESLALMALAALLLYPRYQMRSRGVR